MRRAEGIAAIPASAVPWLSVAQMREVDRIMVDELSISLVRMMENAGRSLAELTRHLLGSDVRSCSVVLLVGPGGNGGGGLVAARHLAVAGAEVAVILGAADARFAPVPGEQLEIARRLGIPIHDRKTGPGCQPDIVIDALLGYSQRGSPRGDVAELIRWSAAHRVLALDVPSGLELSRGRLLTPHITAEATMTLAAPKAGLRGPAASATVGRLFLADISVPALVYGRLGVPYESPFGTGPLVELSAYQTSAAGTLR
jgi:NAD(P)H-hydrate epimerase